MATVKNYAIPRIEKIGRNVHEIQKRCAHVNRTAAASAVNVDSNRSHLNRNVLGTDNADWYAEIKSRLSTLEHYKKYKLRKDAVILIEIVVTYSHSFQELMHDQYGETKQDAWLENWINKNNEWIQNIFGGEQNIIQGKLHADEATIHIHYAVIPELNGKLCGNKYIGGPAGLRRLHDNYAKSMQDLGLKRGLKTGSKRMQHFDIHKLYEKTTENIVDLPASYEGESCEEYSNRIKEEYRAVQLKAASLQIELDSLKNIRDYAHELEAENEELKQRRIGKLYIENIIAAIQNHPDQLLANQFVKALETNLEDWNNFGAQFVKHSASTEYHSSTEELNATEDPIDNRE